MHAEAWDQFIKILAGDARIEDGYQAATRRREIRLTTAAKPTPIY